MKAAQHEMARAALKTYSHLASKRSMPSEYDLATSDLHYYVRRGFEVDVPLGDWYARYQRASAFRCRDWEQFRDPRETTYTKYTELQRRQESFVDGLFEFAERTGYDRRLPEEWVRTLSPLLAPLCYPWHGFSMIAAYIGQMAPGSRVTVAAMFQAADEVRRIQRIAYRTRELSRSYPDFGRDRKEQWQSAPCWQPLREAVERLLCAYDFGESFVGLNLVLKPLLDDLFMTRLAGTADRRGDLLLRGLLFSLNDDCEWQRAWTRALVALVLEDNVASRRAVEGWIEKWLPFALRAVRALSPSVNEDVALAEAELEARYAAHLDGCGGLACPAWASVLPGGDRR